MNKVIIFLSLLGLLIIGCTMSSNKTLAINRNMFFFQSKDKYPFDSFSQVTLYLVNNSRSSVNVLLSDKGRKINTNILSAGVDLNKNEIDTLLQIVNDSSNFDTYACTTYQLEGGFVFRDAKDKIIGTIELGCSFSQFHVLYKNNLISSGVLNDKGNREFDIIWNKIINRKK